MELKCYNQAGQCFLLRERPLEPPDCWGEGLTEPDEEDYDEEDESDG